MTDDNLDSFSLDLSDADFLEDWDGVISAEMIAQDLAASMSERHTEWNFQDEQRGDSAATEGDNERKLNDETSPGEESFVNADLLDVYVDWDQERKDRDHSQRVEIRLEHLRADREARALLAVEIGAFGVFDPADVIDIDGLHDLAATEYLVEKLLERSAMTMLFSDSYVGKTFLALAWALCVATGGSWLGRSVKQGRVLYVLMEGRASFNKRRQAWEADRGLKLSPGCFVIYSKTVNLLDQVSVASLTDFAKKQQFDLIVFDTLSRGIGGADENSTEMMGRLIASLSQVREAHEPSHVLVLHHSKKDDPEKYRGASVLFAGFDNVLCLRRVMLGDDPMSRADPHRRLIQQKIKSAQPEPDLSMVFEQVSIAGSAVLIQDAQAGMHPIAIHLLDMQVGRPANAGLISRTELKISLVSAGLYTSEASANSRLSTLITSGILSLDQATSEISVA